jgi:membrane fusion protein (multidrug efflux system)
LGLLLLAACSKPGDDAAETAAEGSAAAAPVPVEVAKVARGAMEQVVTATATLASDASVTLSTMASGTLLSFEVEEGASVAKGALLARVDAQDAAMAAEEAGRLQAQLERELVRVRPLVEKGFVARQILTELEARLSSAASARARAGLRAGDGEIRAPFDGLLLRREAQAGALVTPGMPICQFADPKALSARFLLPERWLQSLKVGSKVRLRADARTGWELETTVSRIDATVDASTGTAGIHVAIPADQTEGLRPGMFVRAEFVVDAHADALRIPARAVLYRGQETSVFIVRAKGKESVAERQAIKLGFEYRGFVEVTSGLAEGTEVVVVGQSGLDAGAKVIAHAEAAPAPAPAPAGSGAPTPAEASGAGR